MFLCVVSSGLRRNLVSPTQACHKGTNSDCWEFGSSEAMESLARDGPEREREGERTNSDCWGVRIARVHGVACSRRPAERERERERPFAQAAQLEVAKMQEQDKRQSPEQEDPPGRPGALPQRSRRNERGSLGSLVSLGQPPLVRSATVGAGHMESTQYTPCNI